MVKGTANEPRRRQPQPIRAARYFPPTSDKTERYDRDRHLPGLIPLWPHEIANASRDGRLTILHRLRFALRAERQRGRSGHWSYDLNRHMGLIQAYKAELAMLNANGATGSDSQMADRGRQARPADRD